MSKYRPIYKKIWKDKDFKKSSKDAKLLFIYLATNDACNNSGVYEIPISTISEETGITQPNIKNLLQNGLIKNIEYDMENEVVFVVNARKYSPGGKPSLVEKGILSEYKENSKTYLWNSFLEKNPQFKHLYNGCPTVVQPLSNGSIPIPLPIPIEIEDLNNNKPLKMEIEILEYLNKTAGKKFKPTPTNLGFISGRLGEGYKPEDLRRVVDLKVEEWLDDSKWDKFLRPETLFNATKFSGYANQKKGLIAKQEPNKPTTGSRKLDQIKRLMSPGAGPNLLETSP